MLRASRIAGFAPSRKRTRGATTVRPTNGLPRMSRMSSARSEWSASVWFRNSVSSFATHSVRFATYRMAEPTTSTMSANTPSTTRRRILPTVQRTGCGTCSTTSWISSRISSAKPCGCGFSSSGRFWSVMASEGWADGELQLVDEPAPDQRIDRSRAPCHVETQRPEWKIHAGPEAEHVLDVARVGQRVPAARHEVPRFDVRRPRPDIPGVDIGLHAERADQGDAQFEVRLEEREAARARQAVLVEAAH